MRSIVLSLFFLLVFNTALANANTLNCAENKLVCLEQAHRMSLQTLQNSYDFFNRQNTTAFNFSITDTEKLISIFTESHQQPKWIFKNNPVIDDLKCGDSSAAYINDQTRQIYLCEDAFKSVETLSHNMIHEAYHLYQYQNLPNSIEASQYPGLGPQRIYLECVATEFALANILINDLPLELSDYFFNQACEPTVLNIHQLSDLLQKSPRIETLLNINIDAGFKIIQIEPLISSKKETLERAQEMVTTRVQIEFKDQSLQILEIINKGLPIYLKDLKKNLEK